MNSLKLIAISLVLHFHFQQPILSQPENRVSVIFDSDMGPDYDDVGAIAVLHALADSGYVKILATVASTKYEGVASVFEIFNTYFNRPEIPIGVPKGEAQVIKDRQHWTDTLLKKYSHTIMRNADVPDAVVVYRRILAGEPDQSVTIVTVGFLTNLAGLLQTKADQYSNLDGAALVRRKVKQLVCMAGWFPQGREFNIHIDAAASKVVFENWGTPVLLSGFEVGVKIKTGLPLISDKSIEKSPVKDVFRICIPLDPQDVNGRSSWDETAVLVAVKGVKPFYDVKEGKMLVAADGSNTWSLGGTGHRYLVERQPPETIRNVIDALIMHQPDER